MFSSVLIRKGYCYRVYPSPSQAARFTAWQHTLRYLWNVAHEQRRIGAARPRGERRYYSAFDQINELKELRAELPWLADVPRDVCAQLLVELDKAWQRMFLGLAEAPRFKRKGRDELSACEPHPKAFRLTGDVIWFPKLGELRAVVHRPLEGIPKTCTLFRDGDQWFVSISCEVELAEPTLRSEPVVAIDRGVINLAADSDGTLVEAPRYYRRARRRLTRAQRVVSRRKKGSKNREKAKARVARLHRKVRRQRAYLLHRLSAAYAKSHGTVVVEDLKVANMVRIRGGLARGIHDAGWGCFEQMLAYKLEWSGGRLLKVNAAYSSQTCSSCAAVDARSRRSQARFVCTSCGYDAHADLNAAVVLKSRVIPPALPVEGSLPEGARRSRKRLRVPRRAPGKPRPSGRG